MSKYKVRDVVNTTSEFGERTFAIVSIETIGYRAVALKDRKRYNITDDQISGRVGEISEDSPLLLEDEYDHFDGQAYCLQQAREFPAEAQKWQILAKLKGGDKITLVHRKTIFKDAEFVGINFKRPIHPIRAKIKGLAHDFRLSSLMTEI